MYLYRVFWVMLSHLTEEQIKDIMFSRHPHAIMKEENQDIERICLAESVEDTTSIGWNRWIPLSKILWMRSRKR